MSRKLWFVITVLGIIYGGRGVFGQQQDGGVTLNQKDTGYRGIWYCCGKTPGEYIYKYSGGLGTYCAKHRPMAVYCEKVNKTFFCYGGAKKDKNRHLMHMVSYYDHATDQVPRPTILLDKQTDDAHDNPVISVDDDGFIWIFSTSHGTSRPSYIHKSKWPYDIDEFERVAATKQGDGGEEAFDNFSYFQPWYISGKGFVAFMTLYRNPVLRTPFFITSADEKSWTKPLRLAVMGQGHYQISTANAVKAATALNYHPKKGGINRRTNLYYIETHDFGKSWQTVDGRHVELPLADPTCSALAYDFESQGLSVYLKDICFDGENRPVILVVTSKGWQLGPETGARTWTVVRWTGKAWKVTPAFTSDNNYDTGSLFVEDGKWRIVGPTVVGPQAFNPGGEMMMWESVNEGQTWNRVKQLTCNSRRNHNYARGVVNGRSDFYAIWADGHGREPSASNLYFCDKTGKVYVLPETMHHDFERPQRISCDNGL